MARSVEIESCFAYLTFPRVRVRRLGKVEAEAEAGGGLRRMAPVNLRETNVEVKKRVVGISRGGLEPFNMQTAMQKGMLDPCGDTECVTIGGPMKEQLA